MARCEGFLACNISLALASTHPGIQPHHHVKIVLFWTSVSDAPCSLPSNSQYPRKPGDEKVSEEWTEKLSRRRGRIGKHSFKDKIIVVIFRSYLIVGFCWWCASVCAADLELHRDIYRWSKLS